jgi:hypothetical protein
MTEPKNPPAGSRPHQLPKALKGPAHRDRRRARPTKVYDLDCRSGPGDQAATVAAAGISAASRCSTLVFEREMNGRGGDERPVPA